MEVGNIVANGVKINCLRIEISDTGMKSKEIANAVNEMGKYRLIPGHAVNFVVSISFVRDINWHRIMIAFNVSLHKYYRFIFILII